MHREGGEEGVAFWYYVVVGTGVNSSGNGSGQLQGLPAVSEVVVELETQDKPRGDLNSCTKAWTEKHHEWGSSTMTSQHMQAC